MHSDFKHINHTESLNFLHTDLDYYKKNSMVWEKKKAWRVEEQSKETEPQTPEGVERNHVLTPLQEWLPKILDLETGDSAELTVHFSDPHTKTASTWPYQSFCSALQTWPTFLILHRGWFQYGNSNIVIFREMPMALCKKKERRRSCRTRTFPSSYSITQT